MVELVMQKLQSSSIEQYKKEERSILAKRLLNSKSRSNILIDCMCKDEISTQENIRELREFLYNFTLDLKFRRCDTMGDILKVALDFVRRNYENVNMKRLLEG